MGSLHEVSNTLGVGLLEVGLDGSHVTLEVSTIGLLIERSGAQVVAILQVVDGLGVSGDGGLLSLLSVGLNVAILSDDDALQRYNNEGTNQARVSAMDQRDQIFKSRKKIEPTLLVLS